MSENKSFQNRLAREKSPYLLQHAHNPVDWFAWGQEAFDKAKQEDKPIFLSIGYSTCHWCHVMEKESFENPEIAELLNQLFVSIKVDREERPDIDSIYMSAVQVITGQGGWPLSVFLTPDKKPFFGGTYFPPQAKWGSPGFSDVLFSIHQAWKNNRQQLLESGDSLTDILQRRNEDEEDPQELSDQTLHVAYKEFERGFDSQFGGFGPAPKFPTGHNLTFLLRYWNKTRKDNVLSMVELTLQKMAEGGLYDHLGGGFHRYSVDREWQIPHFEKMLYDQAIITRTYLEAYQITKNEFYAQTVRETFDYVLRELHHPDGGFYCAEDADSLDPYDQGNLEKMEGSFYLWKSDHLEKILGKEKAEILFYHYGFHASGNAKSDPHGEFTGKNVLAIENNIEKVAEKFNKSLEAIKEILNSSKKALFKERLKRPRPHLDDKILTDWNGLMISSLAFGALVLNDNRYKDAAVKAADFIIDKLLVKGRLLHRFRDGQSAIDATLEDYAFFSNGLLDLYEATAQSKYLKLAIELIDVINDRFWDKKAGGYFMTADDAPELLYRAKEVYDGATPSGNSMAATVLVRLYYITFNKKFEGLFQDAIKNFSKDISIRPSAYCQMMIAFNHMLGPSQEMVISFQSGDKEFQEYIKKIFNYYIPNKILLFRENILQKDRILLSVSPFVENYTAVNKLATLYLCENHVCKKPINDLKQVDSILAEIF